MNWLVFGVIGCLTMLILLVIVLKASQVEHHNINVKNREFEVYLSSEFHGHMCCVSIYEIVRPTWKIFRTTYRAYKTFWISDFETIKEGVCAMIDSYIIDEEEERLINEKWNEVK